MRARAGIVGQRGLRRIDAMLFNVLVDTCQQEEIVTV